MLFLPSCGQLLSLKRLRYIFIGNDITHCDTQYLSESGEVKFADVTLDLVSNKRFGFLLPDSFLPGCDGASSSAVPYLCILRICEASYNPVLGYVSNFSNAFLNF